MADPAAAVPAANGDLIEAEREIRKAATIGDFGSSASEKILLLLEEYDRRAQEIARHEIEVDDLIVRVMEFSSLLRGMARRVGHERAAYRDQLAGRQDEAERNRLQSIEIERLKVTAQQHANSTSWAAREAVAHMRKADDLADQVAAVREVLAAGKRSDFPGTQLHDRVRAALGGTTDPTCRYCGADCSEGRSWDGGNLYACVSCATARAGTTDTPPPCLPPTPWESRDSRVLDANGVELFLVHNVERWQHDRVAEWLVRVVNEAAGSVSPREDETPEPAPASAHLVDARSKAMRKLLARVEDGMWTAGDAQDVLLDWPNRAADLHDGDSCAEIDEALDNAHGDLNTITEYLFRNGVDVGLYRTVDGLNYRRGIEALIEKRTAAPVSTTPDPAAGAGIDFSPGLHASVSITRSAQAAQAFVKCKCGSESYVDAGSERAWWEAHQASAALAGTATTEQPAELPRDLDAMRTVAAIVAAAGGEIRVTAGDMLREWEVHREADAHGAVTFRARLGKLDPALIGTWADPDFVAHQDHKHAVDGCGYCPSEDSDG